jgi:hypothetical protein
MCPCRGNSVLRRNSKLVAIDVKLLEEGLDLEN